MEEGERYEIRQRREEAGRILEREEMLIWWSQARNEVRPTPFQLFLHHHYFISIHLWYGGRLTCVMGC